MNQTGYDALFQCLDNGDRPIQCYLGIVLFTPVAEATAAGSNLRTYWRELGFQVMPDQCFPLPLFLHCLPFGADRDAIPHMMRYRTMAASHATTLMPVFGDWKGTGSPVLNLVGRAGQLMDLNLFDSATNYNAVVAASSGAGNPGEPRPADRGRHRPATPGDQVRPHRHLRLYPRRPARRAHRG